MGSCDTRQTPARQDVEYYIQNQEPVWLEVSPQAGCGQVSDYETEISDMYNKISADIGSSARGKWFDGIMLDEETGYGFTPGPLITLNTYVQNLVAGSSGGTFWSLEGFVANGSDPNGCQWSDNTYDSVLLQGFQAEQISHQCNIHLVNTEAGRPTLVTWNEQYTPGDGQFSASDPVNTPVYVDSYGDSYHWANHFVSN